MKEIRFTWVDYLLIAIIVGGLGVGITLWLKRLNVSTKVLGAKKEVVAIQKTTSIWIDISGAVEKPGVYQLESDSRVKDVLVVAGGLSSKADRDYVSQSLNLAEKLIDGQKIFIPTVPTSPPTVLGATVGAQQQGISKSEKININKAGMDELMSLSGIGEVRAQEIVDGRPYRAIEDLVARKIVPSSVFEKIKTKISVY